MENTVIKEFLLSSMNTSTRHLKSGTGKELRVERKKLEKSPIQLQQNLF